MQLRSLTVGDAGRVMDLFVECFSDDEYYRRYFGVDGDLVPDEMRKGFRGSLSFCLDKGLSVGLFDGESLIGFSLIFDYKETKEKDPAAFREIFAAPAGDVIPYFDKIHAEMQKLAGKVIYLLSIAVKPEYRRLGLATCMVDHILETHSGCNVASDVSNRDSLSIYEKRNFRIDRIEDAYYLVVHAAGAPVASVDFSGKIMLFVPDTGSLNESGAKYETVREDYRQSGCRIEQGGYFNYFVPDRTCVSRGTLVAVSYAELLKYQRFLNLSQTEERVQGDTVRYENTAGYTEEPLYNDVLREMVESRSAEWSLIPDVFVSIPVSYADKTMLERGEPGGAAKLLLNDLNFMTHYEAGVPSSLTSVDDLADLKGRIHRYYLEKIKIRISREMTPNAYSEFGPAIGPAAYVDVVVSIDTASNCGVLTWYSASCPFLISHLFDNVIRNQILVETADGPVNFFDYIKGRYELKKCGTPKVFAVFPCDKKRLTDCQLASLLFCETIYPEGENLGRITDKDIMDIVRSEKGMGQYDRAFVCAYSNSVLEFMKDYSGSIEDRLLECSITLFFIELILFEEAAIHIADRAIINLFSEKGSENPVKFLSKVDAIYDEYSKTIDFWDVRVNYPSSQKSIHVLRNAFRIKDRLEEMKRNQEQLQRVFDTKSGIIDRRDSKRMDTSLAIISILAVFSAWIDGHQYVATWNDVLSDKTIHVIQRVLFAAVLITAAYAIAHFFRSRGFRRAKKDRGADKKNKREKE